MATTSLKRLSINNDQIKKGDIYRVDPRLLLEEDGFNLRDYDDPDVVAHIEAFADSYAEGSLVPPLIVRTDDQGGIYVIEGHCRRRGALLAIERGVELKAVDCIGYRGNDVERIEIMLRSADGLKLKPLAVAEGYLRLSRMGFSNADIAKRVRKTSAHVEQLLVLAMANNDVHVLLREGKVAADVAIEAIRQHGENAGAFLGSKLEVAQKLGKSRVTRAVVDHGKLPAKKAREIAANLREVVSGIEGAVGNRLSRYLDEEAEIEPGTKVEIDAQDVVNLIRLAKQAAEPK